jgi:hypothetical protein
MSVKSGGDVRYPISHLLVFEGTHILGYVISLSDYDETPYEDDDKNALIDALETFEATISGEWFKQSEILMIFNKEDMLMKKMEKEDKLKNVFPDYKGGQDPEKAKEFIKDLFLKKLISVNRKNVHVVEGYALSDEFIRSDFDKAVCLEKGLKERGNLGIIERKRSETQIDNSTKTSGKFTRKGSQKPQ